MKSKVLGLLFTGTSGACFACASLFVKLCGDVPISLIILVRSLLQIFSCLVLNQVSWRQTLNPKGKLTMLFGFGLLGFVTVYGVYLSFQTISLGEATVIISTCPIFVAVMERVFLGVPVPVPTTVSGLVCSAGVILLTHSGVGAGETVRHGVYGVGFAVVTLATVTQAATFILVRLVTCEGREVFLCVVQILILKHVTLTTRN